MPVPSRLPRELAAHPEAPRQPSRPTGREGDATRQRGASGVAPVRRHAHGRTIGTVPAQPLTTRESAILSAVERRLSNPEIASELFISVRTVESHIASLRRKLGADSRAGLMAAASERREHEASVRVPHNAFVGREGDLERLATAVDRHHCVTITGPGGVGKTRLALEFARSGSRVPVVVELEHAEPGDVVARISRVLDLEAGPGADVATDDPDRAAAAQDRLQFAGQAPGDGSVSGGGAVDDENVGHICLLSLHGDM